MNTTVAPTQVFHVPHNRRLRGLIGAIFAVSLLLLLVLVYQYFASRARIQEEARASAQQQADAAAAQIDGVFAGVMQITADLIAELDSGQLPYDQVQERLQAFTVDHPTIDGVAITFQPYVYDPALELYQHYVYRKGTGFRVLDGATYDYTEPPSEGLGSAETAWYHDPLNNGAMWSEPFFATGAGKILIEYGAPFYPPNVTERTVETANGVVTVDYSIDDIRRLMTSLQLGTTGYGFMLTRTGTYLSHPVSDYVINESIFTTAEAAGSAELRDAAVRALAGELVRIDITDPLTGENSWVFLEPLPSTGWVMGVVLNPLEFEPAARSTIAQQLLIAIVGAVTVFFGVQTLTYPRQFTSSYLWGVAGLFALLCVLLMVATWVITSQPAESSGVRITDRTVMNRYLETYTQNVRSNERPLQIPTGMHVQTVEFPNVDSVIINGYVWQTYPIGAEAPEIQRGFMLPAATGFNNIQEIQRETLDDRELIVWYFFATLSQSFDPGLFPFDTRTIDIRIAPRDLSAPIVLTPDFESYTLINPRLLPGLDASVSINNWDLRESFFNYQEPTYTTSFGIASRSNDSVPELHYSISVERGFLGPFIAYVLPGLVVASMLFAYLINEHKVGDKDEINSALNFSAALFFVIALAHNSLRESVGATGLTYLEYFYIMLYVAIVLIMLNTYVVVRHPNAGIVRFRENLVAKLLYFPVLVGVLLLITVLVFMR